MVKKIPIEVWVGMMVTSSIAAIIVMVTASFYTDWVTTMKIAASVLVMLILLKYLAYTWILNSKKL